MLGDAWKFGDFAYEAVARAYAVAGEKTDCENYIKRAREAGEQIESKEDRDYFFSELETVHPSNGR